MLQPKSAFGHFATNLEITICGGTSNDQFSLKQVEIYDIKQDIWVQQPDLNYERRHPSMCHFRNRWIYVFGGTQLKTKIEIEDEEEFKKQVTNAAENQDASDKSSQFSNKPGSSSDQASKGLQMPKKRPTAILEENDEDDYDEEEVLEAEKDEEEKFNDDFGNEDEEEEDDEDQISAENMSDDDSFIDLEELENDY